MNCDLASNWAPLMSMAGQLLYSIQPRRPVSASPRIQRWPSIGQTLRRFVMFAGNYHAFEAAISKSVRNLGKCDAFWDGSEVKSNKSHCHLLSCVQMCITDTMSSFKYIAKQFSCDSTCLNNYVLARVAERIQSSMQRRDRRFPIGRA